MTTRKLSGAFGVLHHIRQNPFLVIGGLIVLVFVSFALFPSIIAHADPTELNVAGQFTPPSTEHWLGTDEVGRDLFSRIVHGTRYSLGMALGIVVTAAVFGTIVGAIAGFVGGIRDDIMMRIADVFLSLPTFVLAMAIAAVIGRGLVSLYVALSIIWWPVYARLARGMILSLRERLHVESARALGARGPYIIRRHILGFMLKEINVRITIDIGFALVAVASLSFIGLGASRPTPEWGLLLADARQYITGSWWYPVFPGIAITVATVGFSMVGDGLTKVIGEPEEEHQ